MISTVNFTDHFLIAMPALADPNFFHSVTYLCEHSERGAMGIVINRPTELTLQTILNHMEISSTLPNEQISVYSGGPIQPDRGFILHPTGRMWESTLRVGKSISVTTSRDILEAMAGGDGPRQCLVALGYAGWGPGQLEQEIAENAWLTGPSDPDILFRTPSADRWQAAARSFGIDIALVSGVAGHA
ncbi:YqgE/AlgH family protein [Thiorhodospira sibirica]|uniref:YqgE/AlgH family protein n=1 Tax=Thiorhodospira sibirica TaxID=154347 RepID=UPI00022C04EF|nr:YqgE/AlgH family protein [Thiorhodospira sibirica]